MKLRRVLLAVAASALLASVPPASAAPGTDPRVGNLIEESRAALHIEAMHPGEIVRASGKVVALGLSGTGEDWNEMGGTREASAFSTPPLGGGSGWDGHTSWNLDQTGLVIVDGSVIGRAGAINQAYFGNYDLWMPDYDGATVTWGGTKTDKDKTYDVLTVEPPKSQVPFDVWFDLSTHLPVRMIETFGPLVTTITIADFRSIDGLMIPQRVDIASSSGDNAFEATSVDVNPTDGAARLAVPHSTPHDFSIADGATQTTVPIQISDNHVYLDVMLNGKGPYHFVFDTGGANVVDSEAAKEIGLTGNGSAQMTGAGSSTESTSFGTIKALQIGKATVRNQVFVVLPIRKGFGVTAGMPIDGVIGYEVLSRFVTTFDYGDKRVVLQLPGAYMASPGARVVPIEQYGTQPQFACAIDSVPTTCTLDTGARESVSLFTPFIKAHPSVIPAKLSAPGVNGFGVGGRHIGRLGRLKALAFGGFTLHYVVGDYTDQSKGGFAMPFIGANVGGGIWKRFTMTLDYCKLMMALTPNSSFGLRDHWDRSGVFLLDNGAITIVDVRPGTPAARVGLTKGDVIISVNGSSRFSLEDIRQIFLGPVGSVVHLTINRKDGTTRKVDLVLEDFV
jgi:Aspartyl protease/PDZ domain